MLYKQIKAGDVFYESALFSVLELTATTDSVPTTTKDGQVQWKWKATSPKKAGEISYLVTEGMEGYGPNLSKTNPFKGES